MITYVVHRVSPRNLNTRNLFTWHYALLKPPESGDRPPRLHRMRSSILKLGMHPSRDIILTIISIFRTEVYETHVIRPITPPETCLRLPNCGLCESALIKARHSPKAASLYSETNCYYGCDSCVQVIGDLDRMTEVAVNEDLMGLWSREGAIWVHSWCASCCDS